MARIMFRGIWEYCKVLEKLKDEKNDVIKSAVYRGAAIVADEIKAGLKTLPIEEGPNGLPPVGTPEKKLKGVSRRQKADLIDSFGLAPIRKLCQQKNRNGPVHRFGRSYRYEYDILVK